MAELSAFGAGGSVDLSVRNLLQLGLSADLDLGYRAWVPRSSWLSQMSIFNVLLSGGWRVQLVPGFTLYPHIGSGLNVLSASSPSDRNALVSGSSSISAATQLLFVAGVQASLNLSGDLDLSLDLGWRVMGESDTAYHSLTVAIGLGFKAADLSASSSRVQPFSTSVSNTVENGSPKDFDPESFEGNEDIFVIHEVDRTRLIMFQAFGANDTKFDGRIDSQLPTITKYIQSTKGIESIEVLGYVADDGNSANELSLSTARAEVVRDWLQASLKPEWQNIRVRGMGKSNPVAPNNTDIGRKKNRRLEIVIHLEAVQK